MGQQIGLMRFFFVFLQFSLITHAGLLHAQGYALQQLSGSSATSEYRQYAKSGVEAIYSWQFKKAEEAEQYFMSKYPEHPTGFFIKAMRIYWENYPLDEESNEYENHMSLLEKCYDLADEMSEENPENKDAVLFKLMAKSAMIRNYDSYNKTFKAVGAARDVYKLMLQAIEMKENYIEFYFPSGLYNYYREYYPEEYPVYKPFMIFFRSGDKELGLKELEMAVKRSEFSYPEALIYSAKIYFYSEKEREKGLAFFRKLIKSYPKNNYFILEYLKALARVESYKALKEYTEVTSDSPYYAMGFNTFRGLYMLKVKGDYEQAKKHFDASLALDTQTHEFGSTFYNYLYLGLRDYWHHVGDQEKEDYYRKKLKKQ